MVRYIVIHSIENVFMNRTTMGLYAFILKNLEIPYRHV